ncbi:MAG: DUF4919 domain-containing protein [Bacteroidales bacterium]|nr:DUF4919 domain-containing protein [Bacteroidales bacterium]
MRYLRFVCLGLMVLFAQAVSAEGGKSFWKNIRNQVKKEPDKVRLLVDRLARMDSTLTFEESALAFYGQSYLLRDKEEPLVAAMNKLYSSASYEAAFDTAFLVLNINPLNIRALLVSALILSRVDSSFAYGNAQDDVHYFFRRALTLLHIVAQTGDGSEQRPYMVTKISEEYDFLHYYLDIWDIRSQSLNMKMPCDLLTLGDSRQIYFEITRVLELEKEAWGL